MNSYSIQKFNNSYIYNKADVIYSLINNNKNIVELDYNKQSLNFLTDLNNLSNDAINDAVKFLKMFNIITDNFPFDLNTIEEKLHVLQILYIIYS